MKLGSSSNKVNSVKAWLSNEKHSKWLLVFDGADDLASVCISKYFPATNWGDIIITSRDHAVIGMLTEVGCPVEPLLPGEATAVLFDKAGIRKPS